MSGKPGESVVTASRASFPVGPVGGPGLMSEAATPPLLPLAEVTRRAIEVLARELGPADTARFINQFSTGSGDYTADRAGLLGNLTLAEIAAEIRGSATPNQPPPPPTQNGPGN